MLPCSLLALTAIPSPQIIISVQSRYTKQPIHGLFGIIYCICSVNRGNVDLFYMRALVKPPASITPCCLLWSSHTLIASPLSSTPTLQRQTKDASVHEGRRDIRYPEHHAVREEVQEEPCHRRAARHERSPPVEHLPECRRQVALSRNVQGKRDAVRDVRSILVRVLHCCWIKTPSVEVDASVLQT